MAKRRGSGTREAGGQFRREPHGEGDWIAAEMEATLPLAGLKIERRIRRNN